MWKTGAGGRGPGAGLFCALFPLLLPAQDALRQVEARAAELKARGDAAGALQAFEGGPSPLLPDLLWKRADRFVALPVHKTPEGKVQCDIPREFDEQVVARLPA